MPRRSPIRCPANRSQAVTLIELLVVIAVISMLASVSMPAVSGLMRGQDMTRGIFTFSGALEEARSMAMAQNTFVWLGVAEKLTDGRRSVILTAVSARSGQASDLQTGNTRPLMRPVTLNNMSLSESGYQQLEGVDRANSTDFGKSTFSFSQKLPGETSTTLFKAIEFRPSGEIALCAGALRYVGIGLSGGPGDEATRQQAGIQLSRLSGHAVVFR